MRTASSLLAPRFWLLLAILALGGCAHYRLGTDAKLAFASVYVAPIENKSRLPQAQAILATQIREALARDGRVTLANSSATADATLEIVIRDYRRDLASVQERDTGLARKFTLTLEATCTLRTRADNTLFTDRPIKAARDAFTDGGQLQSEYQAAPLLAAALAQKISHAILDVW